MLFHLLTSGTALCSAVIFPKKKGSEGLKQKVKLGDKFLRSASKLCISNLLLMIWTVNLCQYLQTK